MSDVRVTINTPVLPIDHIIRLARKHTGVVSVINSLLAIVLALVIGAVLISIAGISPWEAYSFMIKGSFGSRYSLGETLTRFVPLLFTSLSFTVAHKSGFFNIGAEGQLIIGAVGAVLVGAYIEGLPPFVHILLSLLTGIIFGAAWAGLAGVLKFFLNSDELINTMMLNYIAALLVEFLIQGPLKDPQLFVYESRAVLASARLPVILSKTPLHFGFIISIAVIIGIFYFINNTPAGYQLRTIGANINAAAYAGINIVSVSSMALIISGALAGLGGAVELMGTHFRVISGFSMGYGFDGIGVAVMGRYRPVGIILAAFLFAVIRVGAGAMQRGAGVPYPLLSVIQGLIIIFVIASNYVTNRLTETVIGGRA